METFSAFIFAVFVVLFWRFYVLSACASSFVKTTEDKKATARRRRSLKMADEKYAWEPNEYFLNESRIARFIKEHGISSAEELRERSNDIDWFWRAALEFLDIHWFAPYRKLYDDSEGISHTKWFIGGKLNIYENCIERNIRRGLGDKTCIFYEHESGKEEKITFLEFKKLIDAIAASMKTHGIKKGDFVGMCMPLSIKSAAVMLACFKNGAVCIQMAPTTTSEEIRDIIDHLRITKAKMLFMVDRYIYKGKEYFLDGIFGDAKNIALLGKVVVLENGARKNGPSPFFIEEYGKGEHEILWEDFIKKGKGKTVHTVRCNAEDLALMLFSSGTTNTPKRILHTHGGVLAQVCKEVGFAFDCRENDVFYWVTNFGWMMAPWEIIGALHFGASLVFFEGVPMYPNANRIFELIQKYRVTIFGSTPGHIGEFRKANITGEGYDLSSLRMLGSTGDILHPEHWEWYFETFGKGKCPLNNIIGGTEMKGCFAQGYPNEPCKVGSVGTFALAMGGDIFNEAGESVRGQIGQVVCKNPFPSMTKGFFQNEEGYQEAYFSTFPGVWAHPDCAEIDEDGFVFIRGRTDDIINMKGNKYAPGSIEAPLIGFDEGDFQVIEAVAIGIFDRRRETNIICFVVLKGKEKLSEADVAALKNAVATKFNRQAKPDKIYVVRELPRVRAAKVPHKTIRKVFYGEDTAGLKVINPEALEEIQEWGKEFFALDTFYS